jgi:hypothetical protein
MAGMVSLQGQTGERRMEKHELTVAELDKVAGGMIKLGPTKPIFPPSTGPTFPTEPVIFNRS